MGKRILIIEDEHAMRRVLCLCLEKEGFRVRTAGNGSEGIALWETWNPDVVLTDMKMPGADGMQVLGFKKRRGFRTPLVIITAFGTIDSAVEAMKKGAFDYITKPFDNRQVVAVVKRALKETCDRRETPPQPQTLSRTPIIADALRRTGGNQAKAARLLNITRNTLRYRMKKYGLSSG